MAEHTRERIIVCNCHGSEFSIKDGSVVKDPANEPLKEFADEP